MNVVVMGTGYVGLVSGACLADFGHDVTCVDKDVHRIRALLSGQTPFFEPGLEEVIQTNVAKGRLRFSNDLSEPVRKAAAVVIAVGTPARNGDGHADLSQVYEAASQVAGALSGFTVIVMKSTVPVGTGDEIELLVRKRCPHAEFAVVSNPEFLRQGAAVQDFKVPDRIIIGSEDPRARQVMAQIYRPLSLDPTQIIYTSRRNAELTKYAANAFLATKIAFINEIADLCERVDGDVDEVALGIGLDRRIGSQFLNAGPGYGGSCFPKDTIALIKAGHQHGAALRIVEAVAASNEQRKTAMAQKITAALNGRVEGKTVGILGLTFKPNTDDMRDTPSMAVISALNNMAAKVRAYDPAGMRAAKRMLPHLSYCEDPYSCAEAADALVIMTDWDEFRTLDLDRLKTEMAQPVIVDLRNVFRAEEMRKRGFTYLSIGRSPVFGPAAAHNLLDTSTDEIAAGSLVKIRLADQAVQTS
jgi:UDPglucose 6-dehydrogenase